MRVGASSSRVDGEWEREGTGERGECCRTRGCIGVVLCVIASPGERARSPTEEPPAPLEPAPVTRGTGGEDEGASWGGREELDSDSEHDAPTSPGVSLRQLADSESDATWANTR